MPDSNDLNHPWLIAVWPGMGNVAISAGYYLISKLRMRGMIEYSADELFDIEHVEVKAGVIQPGRMPRSRLFRWTDPNGRHDLLVFIGEAQPQSGKYMFCKKLLEFTKSMGVERIFTFAAMATQMRPEQPSRVFCAATGEESLHEMQEANLETIEDGHIGGLNGVLLGAAVGQDVPGVCLLGEMPHVFAQLAYPKASLAVLRAFIRIADVDLDLSEITQQAEAADEELSELLSKMESAMSGQRPEEEQEEPYSAGFYDEKPLSDDDERRIERMFEIAERDRSRAYELKQELDRLQIFQDYEDRFLDLFKKSD